MVTVHTLGCDIAVRFEHDDAIVASFRRLWSRSVTERSNAHGSEPLVVEAVTGTDGEVQHALARDITLAAIEARSHDLWMMHAAGLADPVSGMTVALVAPSGTGKSTAAQELGRRWAYLSDETVGVDRRGHVLAHPKPISRVVEGWSLKQQVGPDDLGLIPSPSTTWLGAVVLLRRDGRPDPLIERVDRAEAITEVAKESSYLARLGRPLHLLSDALDRTAGVWRVSYGDSAGLERAVAAVFADAATALTERARVEPETVEVEAAEVATTGRDTAVDRVALVDDLLVAAPAFDVIDVDGTRLLMLGERVVGLSPVAAAIHRTLVSHGGLTQGALMAALAEELPLPDEPEEALRRLVAELSAEGVILVGSS